MYVCAQCRDEFATLNQAKVHMRIHISLVGVQRHHRQRELDAPILVGVTHGKRGTYVRGCRCDDCRDAEALYSRKYKRRKARAEDGPLARGHQGAIESPTPDK